MPKYPIFGQNRFTGGQKCRQVRSGVTDESCLCWEAPSSSGTLSFHYHPHPRDYRFISSIDTLFSFVVHHAGRQAWHPTCRNLLDPNQLLANLGGYVSLQAKTLFEPSGFGVEVNLPHLNAFTVSD